MSGLKDALARLREAGQQAKAKGGAKKGHRAPKTTGFTIGKPSARALMIRAGEKKP